MVCLARQTKINRPIEIGVAAFVFCFGLYEVYTDVLIATSSLKFIVESWNTWNITLAAE